MEALISQLSPLLFWDVDPKDIDAKKNSAWLVERVVQRGTWEDWLLVSKFYGKTKLSKLLPNLKLDSKSAHYLEIFCQK